MENPSWRPLLFHGRPLCNARWRKAYAVVFQSCRLCIMTGAIANATTFIIPLALPWYRRFIALARSKNRSFLQLLWIPYVANNSLFLLYFRPLTPHVINRRPRISTIYLCVLYTFAKSFVAQFLYLSDIYTREYS